MPAAAAAPAPASASGPGAADAIEVLDVKFELTNYNYYDLEKGALIQLGARDVSEISQKEAQSSASQSKETLWGELVALTIGGVFDELCKGLSATGPVAAQPAPEPKTPSGLAMLNMAGAPAPAVALPASSPGKTDASPVNVFVTFKPGDKYKIEDKISFLQLVSIGMTTIVQVQLTDKPATGMRFVEQAKVVIEQAIADGTLKKELVDQLTKATGLKPRVIFAGQKSKMRMIPEWSEVTCETHLTKVVRMFEVAYTRRMVPMAFYNECTNFIPALSFSHDNLHSPLDKTKCRKVSLKFAKRWNFNKANWKYGTTKKHEQMDYTAFCHDICEIRYGDGAPKCNVP